MVDRVLWLELAHLDQALGERRNDVLHQIGAQRHRANLEQLLLLLLKLGQAPRLERFPPFTLLLLLRLLLQRQRLGLGLGLSLFGVGDGLGGGDFLLRRAVVTRRAQQDARPAHQRPDVVVLELERERLGGGHRGRGQDGRGAVLRVVCLVHGELCQQRLLRDVEFGHLEHLGLDGLRLRLDDQHELGRRCDRGLGSLALLALLLVSSSLLLLLLALALRRWLRRKQQRRLFAVCRETLEHVALVAALGSRQSLRQHLN
mmetsp:Transcript_7681/g.16985  ORF Transcript_7681/g.16985 Transcript_7681/m.16985 type:complete len:259 (+) Transcript_7681:447-1223(+)